MPVLFFSCSIPLYIEKNPVEKLGKVQEMELEMKMERTSQSAQNSFSKNRILDYIQHNFICQRPGLSKDQISMFKIHILFCKSRFSKWPIEIKVIIKWINKIQKDNIYHTKQYQTFYRKIKCDLQILEEYKMLPSRLSFFH